MFLFMRTALLLAVVNLATSELFVNSTQHGFARFFDDSVQVFQPVTIEPYLTEPDGEYSIEHYRFKFNRTDFLRILPNSIQMLNIDVIERTLIFHQRPNFETNSARYLYRPYHRPHAPIEVELVNAKDKIFRQVQPPNHYLYLSSLRFIESINEELMTPYCEVQFICRSLSSKDNVTKTPILTYIDESVRWRMRYSLELPSTNSDQKPELYAYVDIRNFGGLSINFKEAEFFTGKYLWKRFGIPNRKTARRHSKFAKQSLPLTDVFHQNMHESYGPRYVSKLSIPVSVTLLPNSAKTIKLSKVNVTIESFLRYSSTFSRVASRGKLARVCNITFNDDYIPDGPLTITEQGNFINEETIRNLNKGETYAAFVGYDDGFSYERKFIKPEVSKTFTSTTYLIQYVFTNHKSTPNAHLRFTECFIPALPHSYMKIALITNNSVVSDLNYHDECLQGYINISDQPNQTVISYNLVTGLMVRPPFQALDD